MTKNDYMETITTNRTALAALRSDLKKLRRLEALAKEIPGADKMVSLDVVTTTITEKMAQEKKRKAELEKAKRIVKKLEEIEDIEAGKAGKKAATKKPKATAPAAPAEKTAKAPKAVKATKPTASKKPAAQDQTEAVA